MATNVQFYTLDQLVNVQLDYIRNNLPTAVKGPLGPVTTAIVYATALVALFMQRTMQQILRAARLTTAETVDVDSFVNDFGMSRSPGVAATGEVTFSRIVTAVSTIKVPIGTFVQTNTPVPIRYKVTADSSAFDYDPQLDAYIIRPGLTSCNAKVIAADVGVSGNVNAGQIVRIASAVPGIDNVINDQAFVNGTDVESDDLLRIRFALFIQSLSRATKVAVASAVVNVRSNAIYTITENSDLNGATELGQFVIAIDDGSGSPPDVLIDSVATAVDVVRPVAVRSIVTPPTKIIRICAHIILAYDDKLVLDITAFNAVLLSRLIEYFNGLNFLEMPRIAQVYRTIWDSVSPGDVIEVEVTDNIKTNTNVLFLTNTRGLSVGQSVEVDGVPSVTSRLPRIIALEVEDSIVISPPLTTIPPPGTIVRSFSLRRQQILNVNTMVWERLEYERKTDRTYIENNAATYGGYGGTAYSGIFGGVGGRATKIFLDSVTGIVVNQYIHLESKDIQAKPTTGTTFVALTPVIVQINTTEKAIIVQPALGQLSPDGAWDELQPYEEIISENGSDGPFLDEDEQIAIVTQVGNESGLEQTPISTSIAKIWRADPLEISVILTPLVG